MKKGISLIVLVITIIVMIIIAGAIIISLNSTNIIQRSDEAVEASDVANLKAALTMEYAEILTENHDRVENSTALNTENDVDADEAAGRYADILEEQFEDLAEKGYEVGANANLTWYVLNPEGATV